MLRMADTERTDKKIARIAGGQHGLVTRAQLTEVGISRHSLRRRVDAGRLIAIGRQVFAIAGTPATWERDALAACLDRGPRAVLSHRSAALVWRLTEAKPETIEVTVPYGLSGRGNPVGVVVHRSRSLGSMDCLVVRGLPVTRLERTLVDLAAVAEADELTRCVNEALHRRLVSPAGVRAALVRLAPGGRRGRAQLRRILAPWLAGVESAAEADVLRAMARAGLPVPTTQFKVHAPSGHLVARVDFAWPGPKVALEVDGFRWHANPTMHAEDAARANRLAALGWVVLRTTPAEMATASQQVFAAVRRHLALDAPGRRETALPPG
jgi:very-short-patch-repair endonuclease